MKIKMTIASVILVTVLSASSAYSQVILEADGPGDTYELINSVLAPGYDAVENPECVHPEFGRHIAEIWDTDLNQYAFEFYSHVTPDNDRCINLDRQRVEIKTYAPSPENLKGVSGETITYKWKFKLPVGFKPSSSFTHIHQIKAVGGNDDDPIFTLTPRKGSPNKLELIHDNTTKVSIVSLSLFEGVWVECTEVIYVDSITGTYSIIIKKVSDGTTLLSYSNSNIMTIRSDNAFIRPKWGIYRSLDHPSDLRDEAMRFAGFSIAERNELPVELTSFSASVIGSNVILRWQTATELNNYGFKIERSNNKINFEKIGFIEGSGNSNSDKNYSFTDKQKLSGKYYYRLKQIDNDGTFEYSKVVEADIKLPQTFELKQNYPNPFNPSTFISYSVPINSRVSLTVYNALGQIIKTICDEEKTAGVYLENFKAGSLSSGIYFYTLRADNFVETKKFVINK